MRKVKNVENTGARAAIIINNVKGDISNYVMLDDGTGSDIMIPAVLISQEDGKILKQYFKDNKNSEDKFKNQVQISIDFEMAVKNKTTIDIFYSSEQFKIYKLLKEFYNYQEEFEHKDMIAPHLVSFSNYYYKPKENKNYTNCVNYGKFCANPVLDKGITANDILTENIRQMCIYQYSSEYYWIYMNKFYDWCGSFDFGTRCAEKVISSINDDDFLKKIQTCVKNSGSIKF